MGAFLTGFIIVLGLITLVGWGFSVFDRSNCCCGCSALVLVAWIVAGVLFFVF